MRALKYSSYDVLQVLLESPTLDINLQNQAQESALWYAVTYGTCSVVQSLLQVPKLQVDLPHRRGRTALHLAVWWGKTGLARLLLSSGSDPLTTDDFGKSPRAWAWRIGRPSMKSIFVGPEGAGHSLSFYRPSAGYQTTDKSEPPLHQAVAHGSADAVKLLLTQKELALDVQDHNGDTPLHLAVRCRRLAVVEVLLSHPCASINCRDKDGNTPLWLSTFLSHSDMTERLLETGGIDINFVGGRGQTQTLSTSLHHAVARSDTVALRWLLEIPGIDPNLCVAGVTPFSTAAAKGNTHAMAMLLGKGGLEINATELADPPLCRAVENGRLEAVKLLVRQGEALAINQSTVTVQDTALCIAARAGDSEMVRVLLRHPSVDPNYQNRWFEDPCCLQ
jgi:ankyrin repeat protein